MTLDRRTFLQVGSLALGGLTLPQVLANRATQAPRDNAIILVYCLGGPSHLETYDLKPDGPELMRSVFRPIATSVKGVSICEHLPLQAKQAHRFTLIRSLHHKINIHNDGSINVLTGKEPSVPDPTSLAKSEHPDFGMIAGRVLGPHASGLPRYVTIPYPFHMTRPTYLGMAHQAFTASYPGYVPPQLQLRGLNVKQLDNRRALLSRLDTKRRDMDASANGLDGIRQQAYRVLTSSSVAKAFDLNLESDRLRDHYGRHLWGQGCLLARRLAEAGSTVISVICNVPQYGPTFTNWDDHPGNAMKPGHFATYMKVRFPYFDQAVAALIEDVFERGLDKKIMIAVLGEFGRTPRLRTGPPDKSIGRDHWPDAYSALIAGGGLKMGQVIGSTNARGEYPTSTPVTPQDVLATIYRHLGIDPEQSLMDQTGRPVAILPHGEPIKALL